MEEKTSGRAIARQSCSWSFGANTDFSDNCQGAACNDVIFRKIAQDIVKSGYERFELNQEFLRKSTRTSQTGRAEAALPMN